MQLETANVRLITGLIGVMLILTSFGFGHIMFARIKREKTIAFQTANGEVLVSLSAVEDLIRKITVDVEGIRDARPDVIAGKKGIEINLRLALNAEVNIPDFTARIQDMIKEKFQEILGIDESVVVKIFVAKIVAKEPRQRKRKDSDEEAPNTAVPFQGYKR
jgi:uncharacterized alkaline shock family protein YloU